MLYDPYTIAEMERRRREREKLLRDAERVLQAVMNDQWPPMLPPREEDDD